MDTIVQGKNSVQFHWAVNDTGMNMIWDWAEKEREKEGRRARSERERERERERDVKESSVSLEFGLRGGCSKRDKLHDLSYIHFFGAFCWSSTQRLGTQSQQSVGRDHRPYQCQWDHRPYQWSVESAVSTHRPVSGYRVQTHSHTHTQSTNTLTHTHTHKYFILREILWQGHLESSCLRALKQTLNFRIFYVAFKCLF